MDKMTDGKSDSSDSEGGNLFESAEYDGEEDISLRWFTTARDILKNTWCFESFSERSGAYIGDMKTRVIPDFSMFELKYNLSDDILMDEAKLEIPQILSSVRKSVFIHD